MFNRSLAFNPLARPRALVLVAVVCATALTGCSPKQQASTTRRLQPSERVLLPSGRLATGSKLRMAQQLVRETEPVLRGRKFSSIRDLKLAQRYASEATRIAPRLASAHRLLASILLEQAEFDQAESEFRKALALEPADKKVQRGLDQTERLGALVESLPLRLAQNQRVFRVAEVPRVGGTPGVFALIGIIARWASAPDTGNKDEEADFTSPEVRYFVPIDGQYRETFRTTKVADTRNDPHYISAARVSIGDFQRVGRQQVILATGWFAADAEPTLLDIFEAKDDSLKHILHVDSLHPPELADLNRDGRPEVGVDYYVGVTMPHVSASGWCDVYQYDGRRYVRANARFPQLARQQLQGMIEMNRLHPNDWDVLERLALAYRDVGQPREARVYAGRARHLKAAQRQGKGSG